MSNVIAVKGAIFDLISGLPEATVGGWGIYWGEPQAPVDVSVYLGTSLWSGTDWVKQRTRQEQFSIDVDCVLRRRRASLQDLEIEVAQMGDLISDHISRVPNLGLPEVVTSVVQPKSVESGRLQEFNMAVMSMAVNVTARITSPGVM
jgi:hypothetical protein